MFDSIQLSRKNQDPSIGNLLIKKFPSTRYYGSKRKQFSWLYEVFKGIDGVSALDAFGGTGTVSYLLHSLGWKTTFNDIFLFNTISARALFSDSASRLTESKLIEFINNIEPYSGFITETFQNQFFLDNENQWIDGYMHNLESLTTRPERDLALHCLFQASLKKRPFNLFHRANLSIRTEHRKTKFGNRTTWNKAFSSHVLQTYKEVKEFQCEHDFKINITHGAPAETLEPIYDLIYLDPPYIKEKKRTETYLERYHFLEGLARLGEWPELIDSNTKTKRISKGYDSEWSNKRQLIESLESMASKHRDSIFILSYCAGGAPTEDELANVFYSIFPHVLVQKKDFGRALSHSNATEILMIGAPYGIL